MFLTVTVGLFPVSWGAGQASFELSGRRVEEAAAWVAADGRRLVYGSGRQLRIARLRAGREHGLTVTLDHPLTDGVVLDRWLLLVEQERRLLLVDLESPVPRAREVELQPAPEGRLRLATLGDHLLIAEDGLGLRLLRATTAHPPVVGQVDHRGVSEIGMAPTGLLWIEQDFTAVAATGKTVYLGIRGGGLLVLDLATFDEGRPPRRLDLDFEAHSIAVGGARLYLLGGDGLHVMNVADLEGDVTFHPGIRGESIRAVGRRLHVARGEPGLATFDDRSRVRQTYNVNLGSTFFSPVALTLEPGDSVRWSNAFDFHNVYSCTLTQNGCFEDSNESFVSGPPAVGPWVFSHTFESAGENPYICQSHAPFMTGNVSVQLTDVGPPELPDGTAGLPLRVDKLDPAGSGLALDWDATTCPAVETRILYGAGSAFPKTLDGAYNLLGSVCGVDLGSWVWEPSPAVGLESRRLIWWLVVAGDGQGLEGSWGGNTAGLERSGYGAGGASGECGATGRDLTSACGR